MSPCLISPAESTVEAGSLPKALHNFPNEAKNFAFCGSAVVYACRDPVKKKAAEMVDHREDVPDQSFQQPSLDPLA